MTRIPKRTAVAAATILTLATAVATASTTASASNFDRGGFRGSQSRTVLTDPTDGSAVRGAPDVGLGSLGAELFEGLGGDGECRPHAGFGGACGP